MLVMFQGAHSYISPTRYAAPAVVPTWNYAAVHAYGKPHLIHDVERLKSMVTALLVYHEAGLAAEALPENLLRSIVGIEIPIDRLEGKFKMSQNKSIEDQYGVIAALDQSEGRNQREIAHIMRENLVHQGSEEH